MRLLVEEVRPGPFFTPALYPGVGCCLQAKELSERTHQPCRGLLKQVLKLAAECRPLPRFASVKDFSSWCAESSASAAVQHLQPHPILSVSSPSSSSQMQMHLQPAADPSAGAAAKGCLAAQNALMNDRELTSGSVGERCPSDVIQYGCPFSSW